MCWTRTMRSMDSTCRTTLLRRRQSRRTTTRRCWARMRTETRNRRRTPRERHPPHAVDSPRTSTPPKTSSPTQSPSRMQPSPRTRRRGHPTCTTSPVKRLARQIRRTTKRSTWRRRKRDACRRSIAACSLGKTMDLGRRPRTRANSRLFVSRVVSAVDWRTLPPPRRA